MIFCEFCEISKNTFLTEHLWATASVVLLYLLHFSVFLLLFEYVKLDNSFCYHVLIEVWKI